MLPAALACCRHKGRMAQRRLLGALERRLEHHLKLLEDRNDRRRGALEVILCEALAQRATVQTRSGRGAEGGGRRVVAFQQKGHRGQRERGCGGGGGGGWRWLVERRKRVAGGSDEGSLCGRFGGGLRGGLSGGVRRLPVAAQSYDQRGEGVHVQIPLPAGGRTPPKFGH